MANGSVSALSGGQFEMQLCDELVGKKYVILTEHKNYTVEFLDKDTLFFSQAGNRNYECLKISENIYFVAFGGKPNIIILDTASELVTLILRDVGYVFGTIEQQWMAPRTKRNSYTSKLVGTATRWTFYNGVAFNQVCFSSNRCRAAWPHTEYLNLPARYTEIAHNIYLVDIWRTGAAARLENKGYDRLLLLQNFDTMQLVGCVCGDNVRHEMLTATGESIDVDAALFEE